MPPRETTSPGASPVSQLIPDLPRIGPDLLEVPGMLEHDQRMQKWWDAFKRSSIGTQLEQGKTVRKVVATYTAGLATVEAMLEEEQTVRASADFALASRATALEASIDTPTTGLLARMTVVETTKAELSALTAVADRTTTLEAQVQTPSTGLLARMTTVETTKADASALTAVASRTTTLESEVQTPTTGLLARVSVIESAYVDASGAYAQANSAISAALGGGGSITSAISSSVSTEASARATADGYLAGKYTIKVAAGNVVTGMNVTSSTGGGTDISDIAFQASSFQVYNGTTGLAPFQIVGSKIRFTGNVEIDGSLLVAGTLTLSQVSGAGSLAAQNSVDLSTGQVTNKSLANLDSTANTKLASIDAGADVTLSELNGGLAITGGGITLSAGGAIKGGAISFGSGTGFFLGYEGGQYKFRVGNPAGARIEWDGSAWNVVSFPGGSVPTFVLSLTDSVGNPLYVPTGGGTYDTGDIVTISAPTIPGYTFDRWMGAAYDEAAVDSLTSQTTTVAVTHATSLIANYT